MQTLQERLMHQFLKVESQKSELRSMVSGSGCSSDGAELDHRVQKLSCRALVIAQMLVSDRFAMN